MSNESLIESRRREKVQMYLWMSVLCISAGYPTLVGLNLENNWALFGYALLNFAQGYFLRSWFAAAEHTERAL